MKGFRRFIGSQDAFRSKPFKRGIMLHGKLRGNWWALWIGVIGRFCLRLSKGESQRLHIYCRGWQIWPRKSNSSEQKGE